MLISNLNMHYSTTTNRGPSARRSNAHVTVAVACFSFLYLNDPLNSRVEGFNQRLTNLVLS